jgi:hypothetical protein
LVSADGCYIRLMVKLVSLMVHTIFSFHYVLHIQNQSMVQ